MTNVGEVIRPATARALPRDWVKVVFPRRGCQLRMGVTGSQEPGERLGEGPHLIE